MFSTMAASFADENYEVVEKKIANDIYKVWTVTFNEPLDPKTINNSTVFVKNAFNRAVEVSVNLSADGKSVSVTPSQMYVPGLDYELHITNVVSTQNEVLSPSVKMPFVIEEVVEEKPKQATKSNDSSSQTVSSQQPTEQNKTTTTSNPFNNSVSSKPAANQPTESEQTPKTTQQLTEQKPVHLTSIKVDVKSLVSNVTVKTSNFVAVVTLDGKTAHYQGNNVYELTVPGLKSGDTIKVEAFASYEKNSLLEQINHKVK